MSASLSVAIITLNEAKNLTRTLSRIQNLADEIIIVDSGSTDTTLAVAKNFNAKIYQNAWQGYAEQKNFALSQCSKDYILSLDADEVPDEQLCNAIKNTLAAPSQYAGYVLKRHAVYMGKILQHAFCDKKLRLVKRSSQPMWQGAFVHEALHIEGKTQILPGKLLHYSYENFEEHLSRSINYSKLNAQKKFEQGERFSIIKLICNPVLAFSKSYFWKLGFLDGLPGFIVSKMRALDVFEKYLFLQELSRREVNINDSC
jgi:glycosyltransferase involved in cell wall biosynthesis